MSVILKLHIYVIFMKKYMLFYEEIIEMRFIKA